MIGPTYQRTEGSYTKNTGVERRRAAWDKAKCTPLGVDEGGYRKGIQKDRGGGEGTQYTSALKVFSKAG